MRRIGSRRASKIISQIHVNFICGTNQSPRCLLFFCILKSVYTIPVYCMSIGAQFNVGSSASARRRSDNLRNCKATLTVGSQRVTIGHRRGLTDRKVHARQGKIVLPLAILSKHLGKRRAHTHTLTHLIWLTWKKT